MPLERKKAAQMPPVGIRHSVTPKSARVTRHALLDAGRLFAKHGSAEMPARESLALGVRPMSKTPAFSSNVGNAQRFYGRRDEGPSASR